MVTPAEPVLKQKSQDMGSLRGPRQSAPKGEASNKLNAIEIIKRSAAAEMKGQGNPEGIVLGISALIKKGAIKLLQLGNTVFMIMPKQAGTAEFHTFTVEQPQTLVKRFQAGAKALKQMGFKTAVTYSDSPAFVKMAQSTGLPVRISQGHQTVQGQKKPTYQFILDL